MTEPLPFFQIDAFASRPFEGNQACVIPLDDFLPDPVLQAIAAENNVAETAFIVPAGDGIWHLRWFTPMVEVPLCGHATLASAHVVFRHLGYGEDSVTFRARRSGDLLVSVGADGYVMDFPASGVVRIDPPEGLVEALGAEPVEVWTGAFVAAVFETPQQVRALQPDLRKLAHVAGATGDWERGNVGCFAMGGDVGADVTSRFFAPGSGIDEDPATGSWHCVLAPVVAARGGPEALRCYQAYEGRGAWISTELVGDRVKLSGQAVTVIEGQFRL